ncbi:MAG: AEC family transporter [Halanaerobiaceae bacterium]
MAIFGFILFNNILPIFILAYLGYFLASKFELDIYTLSKVYIYVFLPGLVFIQVYTTDINLEFLTALLFALLLLILLGVMGWFVSKIFNYKVSMSTALNNSIMFYNCGNFGLPLVMLIFGDTPYDSYAVSVQIMILIVQNIATFSIGFLNAGRGQMHYKDTIKKALKMPALHAVLAAVLFRYININLMDYFFWPSIEYIKDGMVPVALLTLGIQLYNTKFNLKNWDVYIASLTRLLGGPILAYILISIMGIEGVMAQVLFISSSVPSAVNTALIAVEFDNEPDFASQVVMTSTILSAVTLTGVIYFSQYLYSI